MKTVDIYDHAPKEKTLSSALELFGDLAVSAFETLFLGKSNGIYWGPSCSPCDIPISELEREQRRIFARVLMDHMSELELAAAGEQWELICEQQGWTLPDAT